MRSRQSRWYGTLMALAALVFAAGCENAPASPQVQGGASDLALRGDRDHESDDDEGNGRRIPFAKLQMFFEFNSTDDDLGVQLLLDGEPWDLVRGVDPVGRTFVEFFGRGRMKELGLTELFFESAEPSPREVLALFPAGEYRFVGRTVEKDRLVGAARLSHDLAPPPVLVPAEGAELDPEDFVVQWRAIAGVAFYQVIVADEETGRKMEIDLPPSATQVTVPPEMLARDREYKIEVLAVLPNGNKTITEQTVSTR